MHRRWVVQRAGGILHAHGAVPLRVRRYRVVAAAAWFGSVFVKQCHSVCAVHPCHGLDREVVGERRAQAAALSLAFASAAAGGFGAGHSVCNAAAVPASKNGAAAAAAAAISLEERPTAAARGGEGAVLRGRARPCPNARRRPIRKLPRVSRPPLSANARHRRLLQHRQLFLALMDEVLDAAEVVALHAGALCSGAHTMHGGGRGGGQRERVRKDER